MRSWQIQNENAEVDLEYKTQIVLLYVPLLLIQQSRATDTLIGLFHATCDPLSAPPHALSPSPVPKGSLLRPITTTYGPQAGTISTSPSDMNVGSVTCSAVRLTILILVEADLTSLFLLSCDTKQFSKTAIGIVRRQWLAMKSSPRRCPQ